VLVVFFDMALYFANVSAFRRLLHEALARHDHTKHLVLDAVAISDLDYTASVALSQVLSDLERDGVTVALARANSVVRAHFEGSSSEALRRVRFFESVDDAARTHR
jgi:MFS superfamily sulfate permease-like transporter